MERSELTFLFTDIVASTRLWQQHGAAMASALETHDRVITEAAASGGGEVFTTGGDGFGIVFADPAIAVASALAAQDTLAGLEVGSDVLRVRMGLHSGPARERDGDFFGLTVNRAARLAAAAHGGQVLVSGVTAAAIDGSVDLILLGEHHLADLLEPISVFQAGAGDFPAINSLDPERNNLPVRFKSFVGRAGAIQEVEDSLRRHRLVTLVGPGGIGKTTLAIEVAAMLLPRNAHGVWLARLEDLPEGASVEHLVARSGRLEVAEGWMRVASRRECLYVIDNAEHVVEAVTNCVRAMLRAGSRSRFLVTSREPLGIPGEHVLRVPPLSLDSEAVELFLDRSGLRRVDDEVIEGIVAMTEGMPLAIELVAGHATAMSPGALYRSLRSEGFEPFETRGVASRHRSEAAAVGWSYELLSEVEADAFRQLAVFPQDFTIESACAVARASPRTILDLVAKSLVQSSGDRLRLLEPIRQFAVLQLVESGELDQARRRHTDRIAYLTETVSRGVGPTAGDVWASVLTATPADVIAACYYAVTHDDVATLRRLFEGIPGVFSLERDAAVGLFEALDPGLPLLMRNPTANRWMILRFAWTERYLDRDEAARERVGFLRRIAVEEDDQILVGACDFVTLLTSVWLGDTDTDTILALADAVTSVAEKSDWWDAGSVKGSAARHLLSSEKYDQAEVLLHQALAEPNVAPLTVEVNRLRLADLLIAGNRPEEALEVLAKIELLAEHAVTPRAHALIAKQQPQAAYRLIEQLVQIDRASGGPTVNPFCPAADYFREVGEHRVATWLMARLLGGGKPTHPVHRSVITSARAALGDRFEAEWKRGEVMEIPALHALIDQG